MKLRLALDAHDQVDDLVVLLATSLARDRLRWRYGPDKAAAAMHRIKASLRSMAAVQYMLLGFAQMVEGQVTAARERAGVCGLLEQASAVASSADAEKALVPHLHRVERPA